MVRSWFFAGALVAHTVAAHDFDALDCQIRDLAYEYAQKLQGDRGDTAMRDIHDSLQLATKCNMPFVRRAGAAGEPRGDFLRRLPLPTKGRVLFVEPADGAKPARAGAHVACVGGRDHVLGCVQRAGDTADPTLAFDSIESALAALGIHRTLQRRHVAAGHLDGPEPATLVLRGGVHRPAATITLDDPAIHSFLTFQSFPGDGEASISGARPITTAWQPHNVRPAGPPGLMRVTNDTTNVYGLKPDNNTVAIVGNFATFGPCEAACVADSACTAFTWHGASTGKLYQGQCWTHYTSSFTTAPQKGHIAGEKVVSPPMNVYVADLAGQGLPNVNSLRVGGRRAQRAAFPNRDPELTIFPDGWVPSGQAGWTAPRDPTTNETFVTVPTPMLHDKTMFQNYMVGVNGHCEHYDPPVSYWCSQHPSGGGAFAFRNPSGITPNQGTTPGFPATINSSFVGAIVNAWRPGHWANWMFEVDEFDAAEGSLGWSYGGFQGARGNNKGAEWFIENVFALLDAPNEYFFDSSTEQLYYFYNGTGAPPADLAFEVPTLQTLAAIRGTMVEPIRNVSFHGVTLRDAAYTYMEPHGVPSGGDWALQRMGALFVEGAEGVGVDRCLFTRVDGNALFLSGYVRGAVIERNEFVWTGDSVMASWGYTAPLGTENAGDQILAQYKSGIDGTAGEQPRGTQVLGNLVHELGHFEKQSSPWFQAKTAQTLLQGNIFFNMPRAGINCKLRDRCALLDRLCSHNLPPIPSPPIPSLFFVS